MSLSEQPALEPEQEIAAAQLEMTSGKAADAVDRLRRLIGAAAFDPLHHYWLAAALGAAGDWEGHHKSLKEAQTFHGLKVIQASGGDLRRFQNDGAYAAAVGEAFLQQDRVAVASLGLGRGTMSDDASLSTLIAYGLALQHQGRVDEAVAAFAWAHDSSPGSPAQSFLLQAMSHEESGVRQHAEEAGRWRRKFGDVSPASPAGFSNPDLGGRPLRVGYVMPELGEEARRSLAPVLDHHDRSRVTPILYLQAHEPAQTVRAAAVRAIGALDDAEAAELIRSDQIDVLVDLWGHGANGRLGVFVRKPAPVQVSWLNNVQTTGAPEIDYLIHADAMDVPGAQDHCVETIWRFGPALWPFRPRSRPALSPTPAKASGHVAFGSDSPPAGLNDRTLDAWARILMRVPGSTLLLRHRCFVDDVLQNAVLIRLAARGVDMDQVRFPGVADPAADGGAFGQIDVALDASPSLSAVPACEAASNGAPFLTLAGGDYVSRIGASVAVSLGLDELAAKSWDDYVERAVALASDIEGLDALRSWIHEAFERSAWRDEHGFTRRLEDSFHEMFAHWQERRVGRTAA